MLLGLARGDEVAVAELHGLRALRAQLAADDHLAALGAILHDEAHHAVASAAHGEAAEELVAEGLALSHGAAGAVLHALREELDAVLREAVALLHDRGELADPAALLAQDLAGPRGTDDDLRADGRHAHLDARIAILCERAHQELVQLRVEYTIGHELALLRDLGLARHGCSVRVVAWMG